MDFKTIFLDHFQKCLADEADIDISIMRNMASGNESSANSTLKELMLDGIVISIPEATLADMDAPLEKLKKLKLTEFGVNYLNHRNKTPHSAKISADFYAKETNIPPATINTAMQAAQWQDYAKIVAKLSAKISNISQDTINTAKQAAKLQNVTREFCSLLDIYKSLFTDYPPEIIGSAEALNELSASIPHANTLASGIHNLFTFEQIQQINAAYTTIGDIATKLYGEKSPRALSKFLRDIENEKIKIPQAEKTPKNVAKDIKTFTFEGILGQNCGNVVESSNEDEKRIQVKGFKVNDGIRVLRGFAKASELYEASEPDIENYQRKVNEPHIEGLKEFISKINAAGKYLPELTFVARGGYELFRPEWGWHLRRTQLGNFKNLEFYKIKFDGKKLYRIDGNHRLEALYQLSQQGQEYYIPFSIILYGKQVHFIDPNQEHELDDFDSDGSYAHVDDEEAKRIKDNEAFLFYFLNSKAQRLTTEENYKGLIGSAWEDHEISIANPNIVLLKYLDRVIKENILSYNFCNNEPLKQITEILDKISEPIEKDLFKEIIRRTNDLLAKNRWPQLKKFNFYCQLIFYIAYKHSDINECSAILDRLENWVKKYNFDNTTFDDPILLYNNAAKTNNLDPINIFVAMPYDNENIGNFTEWINNAINRLDGKYAKYKDRLKLNPIMSKRGYALDLIDNIMNEIDQCGIFIAEISPCVIKDGDQDIKCDANPNVMYELGIAHNLRKPIILMREEVPFTKKVPSDIQEKYRIGYKRSDTRQSQQDIQDAIKSVLDNFFELG